jgi:quinol monooxygenase YgiN
MLVELRRYLLKPGRRDELIELFEREFVDTQEAVGIRLLGLFRDPAEPDHFVWFRGFPDLETRRAALTEFYTGPAWKRHAPAARATMIDTDDVLLLRPVRGSLPVAGDEVTVAVFPLDDPAAVAPAGWTCLVTADVPNTYPALPVREGESVLVTVGTGPPPSLPTGGPAQVARLVPTRRRMDA